MKIRPVGAELFHSDRRTDRHDKSNNRFSKKFANAPKNSVPTAHRTLSICREVIIVYCDILKKPKYSVSTTHRLPL